MSNPDRITLQLNSAALAALFPEGSSARLELQRGVIQNFVATQVRPSALLGGDAEMRKRLTDAVDDARRIVEREVTEFRAALLRRGGVRTDLSRYTLSEEAKAIIREQAQAEIAAVAREAISAALPQLDARINELVREQVAALTARAAMEAVSEAVSVAMSQFRHPSQLRHPSQT